MKSPKSWLALILTALLIIFALQNMAVINVDFLGFGFQMPRFVLIVICVVIGFALGKTIRFRRS